MKMDDFEHNKVECQKCGETVFPHEAQVRGKMTWWCNTCNATMKSLRSRLSWPPNGFETLPEAEKKTFFAKGQGDEGNRWRGGLQEDQGLGCSKHVFEAH